MQHLLMQTILAWVAAAAVTVTLAAAERPVKHAWEWTDEERLAERFNPVSGAYRLAVAKTDGWEIAQSAVEGAIVVDGDRNPELIMPHELMNAIRSGAFSDDPATRKKWREQWSAGERLLGRQFWERFERVAGPFIEADVNNERFSADARTAHDAGRDLLHEKVRAANKAICPSRARALAAARELFGREQFDRFLYEVIAPGMRFRTTPTSEESGLDMFMWVEGGCR